MNMFYELETGMWNAAKAGNSEGFSELVSPGAVMVCGGYRCSGAEYSELIKDFGISGFEITDFEVTAENDGLASVHYIVRTCADKPENADLAGVFHVASVWKKADGKWQLVFNMDSRIWES
ncbi:MAG: nuclear transport factor 2 family protein [Huintestinicola sp.]|uniref:nuclear transport factor 2 family protein n=1 Tax=Huintestinicola sp. TaxID=2981661 RepID=UPI003EFC493B